ncbi:MAG: polyphosphate kinase 1 [Oscillospiraceae bacterium]|nr:polyphosphate kinase 1 [Oscillospiraceae bacterium]
MTRDEEKKLFINRELSWLEFDLRVLELAKERRVPLGEQLKFAAIYASNLDEFFMVRVGSLYDHTLLKAQEKENKTGMTAQEQLDAIMPRTQELQKLADKYTERLFEALEEERYRKVEFAELSKKEEQAWKKYFTEEILPILSPQIVDATHPFPFLYNQFTYVGTVLKNRESGRQAFGIIPLHKQLERIIYFSRDDKLCFALVEELVLHFASLVFGKNEAIREKSLFRITRNADLDVLEAMFDQDLDYREVMSELLKKRRKLAAVRLQMKGENCKEMKRLLCEKLPLDEAQCFEQSSPLDMSFCFKLSARLSKEGNAELFYTPKKPLPPPAGFSLAKAAEEQDVMLCYPYQSIKPFIEMLSEAAQDPEVVSIKMTLYRVADDSKIVEALVNAAENGKEVTAVVELRARFDEQNNIDWSRQLEQAGCRVIYGLPDYKVHSKLTLITRRKSDGEHYTAQIGTGNYNEKTAELYTDLAFITTSREIGQEVNAVFNDLELERNTPAAQKLLVAPLCFKSVLLKEMDREIETQKNGGEGYILLKCNSISDRQIIEKLSEASAAGVTVDMIVRGICCLRAGVEGLSENIRVRSIVGRYLEHSRIYGFGEGEDRRVYIASGDFLTRNTERRVEVGVRVQDPKLSERLWDILQLQLRDNVNAREMKPDGRYVKVKPAPGEDITDSQDAMYDFLNGAWPEAATVAVEKKKKKLWESLKKFLAK